MDAGTLPQTLLSIQKNFQQNINNLGKIWQEAGKTYPSANRYAALL
jgi:hypothetical protein